ncbi:hypothetical protein MSAN_01653100 [Mycena sanguinolenta]|uniref:F-box domain-containing protein n=1 Tax=Mycena sanguinolenta TaxID=230812 RepID=A0A8H6XYY8_9AGAR|nr:hypothetical protein MSAN_01653100 [Mycena sanguinolenta]
MSLSESRFTNRLNTNYVPSDSEILEIRSLLVGPAEELARIDARIEELESALAQLREERASLKEPIDAHKALISPMRFIPNDVLLEIFSSCLPLEHNALIDPTEAPLLLGRISQHWRSVAYSAPMLWSSIHIPSLSYRFTSSQIVLELERIVEAWLARSASCPLSVSFHDVSNDVGDPDFNPETSPFEQHPLVLQLVAVSQRLRSLTLVGGAKLLRPLLLLSQEDVPLLKKIRVETGLYRPWQLPSTNILQTPTLEELTFITRYIDPLSLSLPWSQLTSLHVECDDLDFNGARDVLRKCPNLEQCEIRVVDSSNYSGLTGSLPPTILPLLHTLAFTGDLSFIEKWTSNLVAPNLRYLKIGYITPDRGDDQGTQVST